jgi:tRNA threonylcarbamoyladenosine biosynthesis protein TsaE
MTSWQLVIAGEDKMEALAALLALGCRDTDCLLLEGDVGAGKTTFARAFIRAISPVQDDIVSPTFTLVQTYPLHSDITLWHYDLYRLKHEDELQELGLEDAFASGLTLIEWPAIARDWLPDTALKITITHDVNASQRQVHFSGLSSVWEHRLQQVAEKI